MSKFDYFGLHVLKYLKAEIALNRDHGISYYPVEVCSSNFVSLRVLLDVKELQHCCFTQHLQLQV